MVEPGNKDQVRKVHMVRRDHKVRMVHKARRVHMARKDHKVCKANFPREILGCRAWDWHNNLLHKDHKACKGNCKDRNGTFYFILKI